MIKLTGISPDTEEKTRTIMRVIFPQIKGLERLGWRDPGPGDDEYELLILEAGSTGIHHGSAFRENPDDCELSYMIWDGIDSCHTQPLKVWRVQKATSGT
ncbi:MAG: hypothetical protein NXI32_05090 [bacterium]|nr:hypothetical protein [bacterium]